MMNPQQYLNAKHPAIWHGGDYNPEQWPSSVWNEDVELMQEASFQVATIGVFSWVTLEPAEHRYEFGWLDEVIEKLTSANRWFILATPSAAPPAWMAQKYPEILRTGADRVRRLHGNRVNYNLSSEVYLGKTKEVAEMLAQRYGDHPRLLAWHVSNEYGGADFGQESQAAFRVWLRAKYGSLDVLNAAYWSAFWSHTFTDWGQIEAPGAPYGEVAIHGLTLDWNRFVTDQTIVFMDNEAEPLRRIAPHVPVTTNFMGTYPGLDYRRFKGKLDFCSWDSYPAFTGKLTETRTWVEVAFKHDLTRCLSDDRKWMLMECSPNSSNWYPTMALKKPRMNRFECLQAVAHGADGVQYFQWRQSRGSQEQFHGAVVGHAGGSSARVFQDVRQVGIDLETMADVAGSRFKAEVALIYDWEIRWALDSACGPVQRDKGYEATCIDHYQPFWEAGISVDVIGLDDSLEDYQILVAPMIYSLRPGFADRVRAFVEAGGLFVATYMSGWVDENGLVFEGGFLGPLKDVLGIRSEELDVVDFMGENLIKMDGLGMDGEFPIVDFTELIHVESAQVLGRYASDFYAGRPAVTVNHLGLGKAYYVASRNNLGFTRELLNSIIQETNLKETGIALPEGVTVQKRFGENHEWWFFLNASSETNIVATEKWGEIALGPWDVQLKSTRIDQPTNSFQGDGAIAVL